MQIRAIRGPKILYIIKSPRSVENPMKRVFHKAKNKKEAEEWDILQQISMTPDERLFVADQLKKRVYGERVPDVKEAHKK